MAGIEVATGELTGAYLDTSFDIFFNFIFFINFILIQN